MITSQTRPGALVLLVLLSSLLPAHLSGQEVAVGVDPLEVMGQPQGRALAGTELHNHTEELTDRMRCPVCQGLSIADSDTAIAMAMKAEVRQLLAAGYSDEQILNYFEASYGEFIRLEPKPTGFNLLVWIAPVVVLLIGFFLVARRLRSPGRVPVRQQASLEADDLVEADDLDEYRARVRREMGS